MVTALEGWSPRGPVTELTEDDSRERVSATGFGRLGVAVGCQPQSFPIGFTVAGRDIVFRTAPGTKLRSLVENPQLVLEADERTEFGSWSVVITGTAAVLQDPAEATAASTLALPEWIPGEDFVFVRISPARIRGRDFACHVHATRLPSAASPS